MLPLAFIPIAERWGRRPDSSCRIWNRHARLRRDPVDEPTSPGRYPARKQFSWQPCPDPGHASACPVIFHVGKYDPLTNGAGIIRIFGMRLVPGESVPPGTEADRLSAGAGVEWRGRCARYVGGQLRVASLVAVRVEKERHEVGVVLIA